MWMLGKYSTANSVVNSVAWDVAGLASDGMPLARLRADSDVVAPVFVLLGAVVLMVASVIVSVKAPSTLLRDDCLRQKCKLGL